MTRHHLFDPEGLAPALGFSHGAVSLPGRTVHVAGQIGARGDGTLPPGLVHQFAQACRNVVAVVEEAGGTPDDVVSMVIFTTDMEGYRDGLAPLGSAYREVFGRHYPPMALIGVSQLLHPEALVELLCVAVVPEP